jgi:hypothetical protein
MGSANRRRGGSFRLPASLYFPYRQEQVQNMRDDTSPTAKGAAERSGGAEPRFRTLLYRFLFFDWLFADMTQTMTLFERHAAWQHNRAMRRYLPTYLRRWSALGVLSFDLGWLFEQGLQARVVAACFFTGTSISLVGVALIVALWLLLSNSQVS